MAVYDMTYAPLPGTSTRVVNQFWSDWHQQLDDKAKTEFVRRNPGVNIPPPPSPIDPAGWDSPLMYEGPDNRYKYQPPLVAAIESDSAKAERKQREEREMVARARAQKERERLHPCGFDSSGFQNCGLTICWMKVEDNK